MKKLIIGIDIGGTSIKMGAIPHGSQKIKYRNTISTSSQANNSDFLKTILQGILELKTKFQSNEIIEAIGIGSPGPLDTNKGIILETANLKNLKKCKIRSYLEKQFKARVYLQNDASCAALGHKFFGLGKKDSDFMVFTLGTGVGGGLVLNHKLFTGYSGNAFEIGHVPMADQSLLKTDYYVKCGCGSHGCLETFASASAVVKMYHFFHSQKKKSKKPSVVAFPREVAELAEKNDKIALKVFKIVGESLGLASVHLIQNLNLSLLIFSGGLSASQHLFSDTIQKVIKERTLPLLYSRLKIKYTVGNEDFAILGAASLCL